MALTLVSVTIARARVELDRTVIAPEMSEAMGPIATHLAQGMPFGYAGSPTTGC